MTASDIAQLTFLGLVWLWVAITLVVLWRQDRRLDREERDL